MPREINREEGQADEGQPVRIVAAGKPVDVVLLGEILSDLMVALETTQYEAAGGDTTPLSVHVNELRHRLDALLRRWKRV